MSNKSSYTADEWQIIFKAPPMAGLLVTLASPNGPFGVMKEMFAVGMALGETFQKGSDNELVKALIEDMKARGTTPQRPEGLDTPDKARAATTDALRALDELLTRKTTPEEAKGFKLWLQGIAQKVAEASNEGGFLGFGGEKVSAAEKQALASISEVLHLS
jgi:hypothetical protein